MYAVSGTPAEGLLEEPEAYERLSLDDVYAPAEKGHQVHQVGVVVGDHLEHQVVAAGGGDEVLDLGHRGQGGSRRLGVTGDPCPDHRHPAHAERHRVGNGHDLHHT